MTQRPAAVLWDMDGTLVDTEPYWLAAERELVTSWGGTWTLADGLGLVGSGLEHSAAVLQSRGVALPIPDIIEAVTDLVLAQVRAKLPWRPGARELLLELREAGVPTALVTMSIGRMAREIAEAVGFPAFDAIVPGDEVEHPKPHPAPYLRAAELLGVDPAACVAFEDSATGVASAVAAGARVIAVPLHVPIPAGDGYELRDTLEGLTIADLAVPAGVR